VFLFIKIVKFLFLGIKALEISEFKVSRKVLRFKGIKISELRGFKFFKNFQVIMFLMCNVSWFSGFQESRF
jgi:hypothetical protein